MNQSYIGLVLILIVVCVYTFYSSNYAYVSDMKDKHGLTKETENIFQDKWRNVLENNKDVFDDRNSENISKINLSELTLRQSSSQLKAEGNQRQGDGISFNICCGVDQMIDATSNDCIDLKTSNRIDYLFHKFVVDSNMGQGDINNPNFEYGFALNNGCTKSEVVSKFSL